MQTTLHLELQAECLLHLATDRAGLNTASLVCRYWLDRTRPSSFRNKALALGHVPPSKVNAIELLSSPHCTLQKYLQWASFRGFEAGLYSPSYKSGANEYDQLNSIILQHLSGLKNIKRLTLSRLTWRLLSVEARDCIATSFPSLDFLEIREIAFPTPIDLVVDMSSLLSQNQPTALTIRHTLFDDRSEVEESEKTNVVWKDVFHPRLTFLDLGYNPTLRGFAAALFSGIQQPSHLTTLCVSQFDENCTSMGTALEALGESLEHLAIHSEQPNPPFDLSKLQVLKTLELAQEITDTVIPHLLQSIRSPVFTDLHLRVWNPDPLVSLDALEFLWQSDSFPKSTKRVYVKYNHAEGGGAKVDIPEEMKKSTGIEFIERWKTTSSAPVFKGWYPYNL